MIDTDLREHTLPDPPGDPFGPHGAGTRVSAVIPVINEAPNLRWVLDRMPALVGEVVLVDGRSTDDTVAIARLLRPDVVVVTEARHGKGRALRAGFAAATGDVIVMLDGDGSMDPAEIPRFVSSLRHADFVKGSRCLAEGDSDDFTALRRIGNRTLLGLVNGLFGQVFTDLCYGYCAFRRADLERLRLAADGFEIETELVVHALKAGMRIAEVPSIEFSRMGGCSNLRVVHDGRRVLRTILRERLSWYPPVPAGAGAGSVNRDLPPAAVTEVQVVAGVGVLSPDGLAPGSTSSPPLTNGVAIGAGRA